MRIDGVPQLERAVSEIIQRPGVNGTGFLVQVVTRKTQEGSFLGARVGRRAEGRPLLRVAQLASSCVRSIGNL